MTFLIISITLIMSEQMLLSALRILFSTSRKLWKDFCHYLFLCHVVVCILSPVSQHIVGLTTLKLNRILQCRHLTNLYDICTSWINFHFSSYFRLNSLNEWVMGKNAVSWQIQCIFGTCNLVKCLSINFVDLYDTWKGNSQQKLW